MATPRAAEDERFEFGAGALCLDFANTVSNRQRAAATEGLHGYADLVAWERAGGLLDAAAGSRLLAAAKRSPAAAARALARALELREAIYRLAAAAAAGRRPDAAAVETVNRSLPQALARLRLEPAEGGFSWRWREGGDDLEQPLWPVARSAAELLTSGDLAAVRECAAGDCSWLFLDRSRNHSRRWCDMKACGNRSKARRYYRRRKARA